jgi:BirA family biotin operon repressor/biotin-[acetyl-CoA-carboxylase] ligase
MMADREAGGPDHHPIVRLQTVDSTQTAAFALADAGAADGTVVIATSQRAGRGRRGRAWLDEPGASLLLSLIVRPRLAPAQWPLLSLMTSVAVARALRQTTGLAAELKWPNDVLVDGRKLAGILLESRLTGQPVVVIGVGINVAQERFPADLQGRATSVRHARGRVVDLDCLLRAVLDEIDVWRARLEGEGFGPIGLAWKSLSHTLGAWVHVDGLSGRAVDLDDDGALVIDDGLSRHRVLAGELIATGADAPRR